MGSIIMSYFVRHELFFSKCHVLENWLFSLEY